MLPVRGKMGFVIGQLWMNDIAVLMCYITYVLFNCFICFAKNLSRLMAEGYVQAVRELCGFWHNGDLHCVSVLCYVALNISTVQGNAWCQQVWVKRTKVRSKFLLVAKTTAMFCWPICCLYMCKHVTAGICCYSCQTYSTPVQEVVPSTVSNLGKESGAFSTSRVFMHCVQHLMTDC